MTLKIHPLLNDPNAVLIYRRPVSDLPADVEFERTACEAMQMMQIELDGKKVAIKPNVTSGEHFADPNTGITTHPAFIGGMVRYLAQHGARRDGIYIVEDPRDSDDFNPRHWKGTGYLEMAAATGARLRCPISYYCVKKNVPRPFVHPVRNVTRYAVDPETILINVPKLKTHNLAITSLCLKNLMGLDDVFDRHYCSQALQVHFMSLDEHMKKQTMDETRHVDWQRGLAYRLADLAQVLPAHLNLVEGVVGRDGTGFNRGTNYPLGLVVGGINPVAVDSVASFIMGFDPGRLIYLQIAAEAGLGSNDLNRLKAYVVEDGRIVPCYDLDKERANPPFRVIRNIAGEN